MVTKKPKTVRVESTGLARKELPKEPPSDYNEKPWKKENQAVCVLCGKQVAVGYMKIHKEHSHGEIPPSRQPAKPGGYNFYLDPHFVSGGLPSLGKNNK